MTSNETERPIPARPRSARVILGILTITFLTAALVGITRSEDSLSEGGPLENLQIAVWTLSILLSLTVLRSNRQGRSFVLWLGLIAALAITRELDLHEHVNPETHNWAYGVNFKIKWWLDASHPLWLKGAWALVFAIVALPVLLLPWLFKKSVLRMFQTRHEALIYLALCGALLFLGYACDDLVGRGQFVSRFISQTLEESFEFGGAIAYAASVFSLRQRPIYQKTKLNTESE